MTATAAWPTCLYCPTGAPARWHIAGGPTAAMDRVREPTCDRHMSKAQAKTRGLAYRETRACQSGDAATAAADDGQGALFDLGGGTG